MARIKSSQLSETERRTRAMTLAELHDSGIDVFCWCNRCGHNAVLATARLAAELGPAFPVPEIGARTRCSGCGSRDVATRPAWPAIGQVTNHAGSERAAAEPTPAAEIPDPAKESV